MGAEVSVPTLAGKVNTKTSVARWLFALADPESVPDGYPVERLDLERARDLGLLANAHGVLPAVLDRMDHLLHSDPGRFLTVQSGMAETWAALTPLRERLAQRAAMALFLEVEANLLLKHLTAAGAKAILLKGPDFAARLYSRRALRTFGDIDLLVRPDDWDCVAATMASRGYLSRETPLKYAGGYAERTWENPAMPGAMVEVHDNLVNSPTVRRGVSVGLEDLPLERGTGGELRATPAGLLLIATVHGAASHSFDKVQHLCDLAQIVRGRAGTIDETSLRECAARTRSEFCVALGLDLTARALNAGAPAELLNRLDWRWPRRRARLLITPGVVVRSQGKRRHYESWRRQLLRQMLKSRR